MLRAFLFYRLSIALSGGFSENVYRLAEGVAGYVEA